jgi:predicted anti-sigma-YlaC factor YlaD
MIKNDNKMNCNKIHNQIIFYLEGDLPSSEMTKFEDHLQCCESCSKLTNEIKQTLTIIPLQKNNETSPYFYTRVKARLEDNTSSREKFLPRFAQAAIFSVLLVATIFIGIELGDTSSSITTSEVHPNSELLPFFDGLKQEPIETFLMK